MSEYIVVVVWMLLIMFLSVIFNFYRKEYVLGQKVWRVTPFYALLAFLPIILYSGFRGNVGDTYAYKMQFANMPIVFSELREYMQGIGKDKGFYLLSAILKIIFNGNVTAYFVFLAFLQGLLLIGVYRKYTKDYFFAIFLFVISTDYISWMQNGMRQFTAVTLIFAATGLMLKKKYILTILVILLASTMHGSALLMIPVIFIAQGKAWNKRTLLFILGIMLAFFFVDQFTNILDTALEDTQYTNVVNDWKSWDDDGTNPIRVLVYAIPTILAFVGRRWIRTEGDDVINLCVNMSVVSTGLYVISMVTSGIMIGRLPIYASLYNYILLPWEIEHIFSKPIARTLQAMMIMFYIGFYYFQMHFVWGML